MDRISTIVSIINHDLTYALRLRGFVYGLCEKNTVDSKTFFVEKKANTVQKGIFLDDSESLTIIHYSDSIANEIDFEKGFGASPLIKEEYSNVILVYIPNTNNELESKNILEKLSTSFPSTICNEDKLLLKVRSVNISGTSKLYNKHAIFADEFTGQVDNLQDNAILLKINYQVMLKIDKACYTLDCVEEDVCSTTNTWGGNVEI